MDLIGLCVMTLRKLNTYLIHCNPINTDLENELKINRCKLGFNGFNRCENSFTR